MTVKQAMEELSKYPPTMELFMAERLTEFKYGLINSIRPKVIDFVEDPGGPVLGRDKALIISEE